MAAMSITQVAYTSRALASFSEQDLDDMLATARIKNKALGLSGLLLYQDGHFLQFLEGRDYAVDALLKTIEADQRHDAVKLIWRRDIETCDFGDWQMGFMRVKPEPDQAGFVDILQSLSSDQLQLDERATKTQELIDAFKGDKWRNMVLS